MEGHAILKDKSNLEKGLFGLWAIRTAVGEAGKEVSRTNLARFLWLAFEIRVGGSNLVRALRVKEAKDRVENVHGVTFQILPPGINYAKGLAGL